MRIGCEVNFEKRGKLGDHVNCPVTGWCICCCYHCNKKILTLLLTFAFLLLPFYFSSAAEIPYTYTVINQPGIAKDVNTHGEIVLNNLNSGTAQPGGTLLTKKQRQATHFQCTNTTTDDTIIKKIDNQGNVVGDCNAAGFVRTKIGAVLTVDVPGSDITLVNAVNNGLVGGQFFNPFTNPDQSGFERMHGFIRLIDGTYRTLDFPQFDTVTEITGVNKLRQRVGNVFSFDPDTNATGDFIAFMEDNGSFTLLSVPGAQFTFALDINNNGDVLLDSSIGNYFFSDSLYFKIADPVLDPAFKLLEVQVNGFNDDLDIVGIYLQRDAACVPQGFITCPVTTKSFVASPNPLGLTKK